MPTLPAALAEIAEDFQAVPARDRLQLLLDFSWDLPDLPPRLSGDYGLLEQVSECQTPIFLRVELDDDGVHLFIDAPAEAPTTRGFAEVLRSGLDGLTADAVLDLPDDVAQLLGLGEAVSPLRLRGMAGMIARIKRQLRERMAA